MADEKTSSKNGEHREQDAQEADAILDTGEALDPFTRLQKKKVAVPQTATSQEKNEQVTAVVKK